MLVEGVFSRRTIEMRISLKAVQILGQNMTKFQDKTEDYFNVYISVIVKEETKDSVGWW